MKLDDIPSVWFHNLLEGAKRKPILLLGGKQESWAKSTMMSATRIRSIQGLARQLALPQRTATATFTTTARRLEAGHAVPAKPSETTAQVTEEPAPVEVKQAPNRTGIWAPSQRPRAQAMTGPRFEQTNFDLQVWIGQLERTCNAHRELIEDWILSF